MSQIRTNPPFYFNIARWMQQRDIRGGHKLERYLGQFGFLNQVVECRPGDSERIYIPIGARRYDPDTILNYEPELIDFLFDRIESISQPATLLDCGADIGIIGALLASRTNKLKRIVYVEPSTDAHEYLEKSAQSLSCETRVVKAAVGLKSGRGSLTRPEYDTADTGRFVDLSEEGDVDIYSSDDILADHDLDHLILKIDVEGLEHDVVIGATESLKRCANYTVVFEANYAVIERTGVDPVKVLEALNSIIPGGQLLVLEDPELRLDLSREILPQLKIDRTVVRNLAYSSPV